MSVLTERGDSDCTHWQNVVSLALGEGLGAQQKGHGARIIDGKREGDFILGGPAVLCASGLTILAATPEFRDYESDVVCPVRS